MIMDAADNAADNAADDDTFIIKCKNNARIHYNTHTTLLSRWCSGHYLQRVGEYTTALDLFTEAQQYHAALDVCAVGNLPVPEVVGEALTAQHATQQAAEVQGRDELMALVLKVAGLAEQAGQHVYAGKKYAQVCYVVCICAYMYFIILYSTCCTCTCCWCCT